MPSGTGQLATQISSFPKPSVATTAAGARFANDFSSASANCRARCALDEGSASPGEIASPLKAHQENARNHVDICRKALKHFFKQRFMLLGQGVDKTIATRVK